MTSDRDLKAHNFKDITGKKFGRWRVLRRSWQPREVEGKILIGTSSSRAVRWICQCDCGVIREVGGEKLRQKKSVSCGCVNAKDMSGRKVGSWKVVKVARDHEGNFKWLCRCGKVWALFNRLALTAKIPPPSLDEIPRRKKKKAVPGATFGTWRPVASAGVTIEAEKNKWVVAEGAGNGTLCECVESGWLLVLPDNMVDSANPPPCPADWEKPQPLRGIDYLGKKFGTWKVIKRAGSTPNRVAVWNCECVKCGAQRGIPSTDLRGASPCKCTVRKTSGRKEATEAVAAASRKKNA
jgi:hypothetical protein